MEIIKGIETQDKKLLILKYSAISLRLEKWKQKYLTLSSMTLSLPWGNSTFFPFTLAVKLFHKSLFIQTVFPASLFSLFGNTVSFLFLNNDFILS